MFNPKIDRIISPHPFTIRNVSITAQAILTQPAAEKQISINLGLFNADIHIIKLISQPGRNRQTLVMV